MSQATCPTTPPTHRRSSQAYLLPLLLILSSPVLWLPLSNAGTPWPRGFCTRGSLSVWYLLRPTLVTPSPPADRDPASPFQKVLRRVFFLNCKPSPVSLSSVPPHPTLHDSSLYSKPCFTLLLLCVSCQSIEFTRFRNCCASRYYPLLPPIPICATSNKTCAWRKINAVNHCQINE